MARQTKSHRPTIDATFLFRKPTGSNFFHVSRLDNTHSNVFTHSIKPFICALSFESKKVVLTSLISLYIKKHHPFYDPQPQSGWRFVRGRNLYTHSRDLTHAIDPFTKKRDCASKRNNRRTTEKRYTDFRVTCCRKPRAVPRVSLEYFLF